MVETRAQEGQRPIFVLGMYRSGTSMVAEMVHRWGAYGGDPGQLSKGDDRNPRGYWESDQLSSWSEEIFRSGLKSLWDPDFERNLLDRAADPEWLAKGRDLAGAMGRQGKVWFWKEPYLGLFLPFWERILTDVTYVVTVRNPYESAVSWQNFLLPPDSGLAGKVSIVAANLLRWQYLMLATLTHVGRSPRKIFISYEEMIRDPAAQSRRLARFLDEQYGVRSDEKTLQAMQEAIDSKLWRNKSVTPFPAVPEATSEQKAFYEFLQAKARGEEIEFDPSRYPLYPGWREYLLNVDLFREHYLQSRRLLAKPAVRLLLAADPLRLAGRVARWFKRPKRNASKAAAQTPAS
jgi:hypothetical protein